MLKHAQECIARCRALASHTEEPGFITRTFLSEPMRRVHADLAGCLPGAFLDNAGNFRTKGEAGKPTLYIGSHLDTVPHAGAFDGVLGVVLAIKLAELARPKRFRVAVVGFSEEEGVRFGFPFIGSLAMIGELTPEMRARTDARGVSVAAAIESYGVNADQCEPIRTGLGYLEFHIEQGPVLESLNRPLGVVEAICGQTRMDLTFEGQAGHAGTTPMHLRRDALAGAAEWMGEVERRAGGLPGLVATVGRVEVSPGAPNVIPGSVKLTLDVRHREDKLRREAVECFLSRANAIAERRMLQFGSELRLEQASVSMDGELSNLLGEAARQAGFEPHFMPSGAGHDAMILARCMPAAMLFLRSPGGLSHHPDESVLAEDVAAALETGLNFLEELEHRA